MEKNINIAELLKGCPKGMELDCLLFENTSVYLSNVTTDPSYPIEIKVKYPYKELETFALNKYGAIYDRPTAKCVIFPKGKTTWEGFHRPFKDGDVLVHTQNERFIMSIYKSNEIGIIINTHAIFWDREEGLSVGMQICCYTDSTRFATEEEKEKLFDAIKANGYKWNEKTKTLEKLVEPIFKVGDRIKNKNDKWLGTRTIQSYVVGIGYFTTINDWVRIEDQDDWELVLDIKPKFKVGDRIKGKSGKIVYRVVQITGDLYILDNLCSIPISMEHMYDLVPNKFDITTLKPFKSEVLVRDANTDKWRGAFYSYYNSKKFYTIGSSHYYQCIPYKGNEYLLGTTDDCDEYYKTWE